MKSIGGVTALDLHATVRSGIRVTLLVAVLALDVSGLAAQQASVRGAIVERGSQDGIAGATVELSGRPPIQTGTGGAFRFDDVARGRYTLTVRALGWATADTSFLVRGDAMLIIALDPAPVALDPLNVQSYTIEVKGVVVDDATDRPLIEVAMVGLPDRETRTNLVGRFRFKDVRAGEPFVIQVSEMEYLPESFAVIASQDTAIRIGLRPDPIAVRLVANAKQMLKERSEERSWAGVPVITRQDLLLNVNRSVLDVLNQMLRGRVGNVACWIINEKIAHTGKERLETMLPDQVEHIEVLSFGFTRDSLMVRIYTRDYFPAIMMRSADILAKDELVESARRGRCR